MQPVDYTTLMAACYELRQAWLPARLERVYQCDRHTIAMALRTLSQRRWLTISWHPQAARICLGHSPPRLPDTFAFSQQLQHQLGNLALVDMGAIAPWERVVDLQFALRPGDPIVWHLYVEVMTKYSNVILVDQQNIVVTAAHQVSPQRSRLRPIQTGQPYEPPPALLKKAPTVTESQERWQEQLSLVPGAIKQNLLQTYCGLSPALVMSLLTQAGVSPEQSTEELKGADWDRLFRLWQDWLGQLGRLAQGESEPGLAPGWGCRGYTVLGWGMTIPASSVQDLLHSYYTTHLQQQRFHQLHQQLQQKLSSILDKLHLKRQGFEQRLQEAALAEEYRQKADLLMAYLHRWQPGLASLTIPDFETETPVMIPLDLGKNGVQNAQILYKQHQKLKRAQGIVMPLLKATQDEITYLEQVATSLAQLPETPGTKDLGALVEIRDELVQQGYLAGDRDRSPGGVLPPESQPYHYETPNGHTVLVGRNNRQNEELTFRLAGNYDLWFHTQEIPGSHVLLRLTPGAAPEDLDLQFAADLAALYSRARQSDQVPVIYTEPRHVYKPRGAKPGIAIYKRERLIWGQPQRISNRSPKIPSE